VPAEHRIPVCKISVDGQALDAVTQARLVRASVDLDAALFAQTSVLFMDPEMELINGRVFESGKSVVLKMGYGAGVQPVFSGEVVGLEPQFRRDEPVALKVMCLDSLHRLALAPMTRTFNDADLSSVVTSIAQEHGLSAEAPSGTKQHFLQNNLTDAEFLRSFAQRMGLRLRLEGKKLTLGPAPEMAAISLAMGDGVKKLKVKLKAGRQVHEVTVHGWDQKGKSEVVGKAKAQGATGKGAMDYGHGTLSEASGSMAPPDVSTAEAVAKGRMNRIAESYATLEVDLIGDSRILPGQIVDIDKFGAGIDGSYRIEIARHEFSRRGYFVHFKAIWQGPKKAAPKQLKPPPPPYAPAKPPEKGRLSRPRWKRRASGSSDVADMGVDATRPLEGKSVRFILETNVSGEWKEVAHADGTIKSGFANATVDIAALAAADVISEPGWTAAKDKKYSHGQEGEVSVKSKVQKPHDVRVVLEQLIAGGRVWEQIDSQMVKVSGDVAKATFALEHPHAAEAAKPHSELLKAPVWDQKPRGKGTPARLGVETPGLADGRKVNFIVERLGRDGKWGAIRTIEARVEKGYVSTSVDLRHTIERPQPADSKRLARPRWEKADLAHGDLGSVSVEAPELDGRRVRFVVERNDGGKWVAAGERVVKVAGGKATAEIQLKHPNSRGQGLEKLGEAKHDPKSGTATVSAGGLEGRRVRFIAEKKAASGWVRLGTMTAKIKGGAASAKVSSPGKDGKLARPTWGARSLTHGDEVQVSVDAPGLDGSEVEFALERLEGKTWVAAGTAKALVAKGKAAASVKVSHPAAAMNGATSQELAKRRLRFQASLSAGTPVQVRAELMPDIDPRKLRFRAELVPDLGAQKVRFRAEPVPDLQPRKLRFRVELPVPENPGLTRLRVELQGGTEEDHVQTDERVSSRSG
jgi:uncharacterized protein